jgi:hypothetical protein
MTRVVARVTNEVEEAPFHKVRSPQMAAMAKFHPRTAHGKLKAVMTPIRPKGFHYSIIKCSGLSDGMILPLRDLDRPQAISQISMNSYTSPSPSARILPISNEMRAPRAFFLSLRASPTYLIISPLLGMGMLIHSFFPLNMAYTVASYSYSVAVVTLAMGSSVAGFMQI